MRHRPTPVSDRVRAAITGEDPELVREVEALERMTSAGVAQAVVNNKDPRDWPLERWLTVLIAIISLTGSILGAVWLLGGKYRQWEDNISTIPAIHIEMAEHRGIWRAIQAEQRRVAYELALRDPRPRQLSPAGASRTPEPAFPRDEQFIVKPPEDREP